MAKLVNPTKVITGPDTRWSYCNAWEPKAINGGTPKYSVSLIIPKSDTRTIEKVRAAIQAAYEEGQSKLKGNGKTVPQLKALKTPLRDGDVKPEMAELKGKRMIIAAELQEGMRLNTSVVKQLCSTDPIFAEKKFKAPFNFEPSHTLVLYTNHLPKVGASDDGTWRRLIVIPFHAKIQGAADIKNYTQYLVDNAGGAVLSWLIEGARKVIEANYQITRPQCVLDAIGAYRDGNDWLGTFINECCEVDKSYQEKSGELYRRYREYCVENGEYIRSTTDFYTALEQAGYKRKRTTHCNVIMGLCIEKIISEVKNDGTT